MSEKPSYEELERRIQELETIQSEYIYLLEVSKENESLFKRLYEKAPLGYQSLDENGHFLVVNQTWLETLGYAKEEVIGKSFAEFLHPHWRGHFKENFPRFKSIGEILGVEFEMIKKNGDLILVSFTGKISRDKNGNFQQTHCLFHDITERIQAEEQLRKSEEEFRNLYDEAPIGYFEYDLHGNIIRVNHTHLKMLGYTAEEMIGQPCWKFIVDEFAREQILAKLNGVRPPAVGWERTYRRKDGTTFPGVIEDRLLMDEDGNIKAVRTAVQDITELKRAENAIRKSEEILKDILETTLSGFWDWNLVDNTEYLSPTFKRMFGYEDHEMENSPEVWQKIIFSEDLPGVLEVFDRHVKSRGLEPFYNEVRYRHRDGSTVWVICAGRVVEWANDWSPVRMVGCHIDITKRKEAEMEREKLQAQLFQAQKMESVGRLAGGVAHDFNNMLGVILGHTEMVLEETDPASPLYADLYSIKQAAERSAALTRQLLAFARKQTVAPKVIDLNETVEGMLKMLRQLIGEHIDILWLPKTNLQPIKVDPAQIDQLLANLCVNARDAITGVGKVTIETDTKIFDEAYCNDHLESLPGEYVLLEVSDDGCGMDKKTLSQIFEPFFTTKDNGQGTGLGLASVFGIVKQNNGFINVYSEPGQGTTFKVYLPVYAVKSDEVVEKVPDLPAEQGKETVLLVEDETAILGMTTKMLERLGYTVVAAATPGEAIHLAHGYKGRIDLLMTDVVMPEMNGRDLAKNLLSHYPKLKRLFMSGYTANVIAHHGVLDEGVHFIQKPFSKKDLGAKLREALES